MWKPLIRSPISSGLEKFHFVTSMWGQLGSFFMWNYEAESTKRGSTVTIIVSCIQLFQHAFNCFSMHLTVSACFSMHSTVSACFSMHSTVSTVSACSCEPLTSKEKECAVSATTRNQKSLQTPCSGVDFAELQKGNVRHGRAEDELKHFLNFSELFSG